MLLLMSSQDSEARSDLSCNRIIPRSLLACLQTNMYTGIVPYGWSNPSRDCLPARHATPARPRVVPVRRRDLSRAVRGFVLGDSLGLLASRTFPPMSGIYQGALPFVGILAQPLALRALQ